MAHTIGNPLSWTARVLGLAGHHITESTRELGGEGATVPPRVRRLSREDIRAALRLGWEDFLASRTDAMFLVFVYPVIGLVLFGVGLHLNLLPLLFPLIAGFAILGPVAAAGLYEISRRREAGEAPRWWHALEVVESPAFGAVLILGFYLTALFIAWMVAAAAIHAATLGPQVPASATAFLTQVFTTPEGWTMIVLGCGVGFLFALVALAISVVSFPLLLDRHVGLPVAVVTSVKVLRKNPGVVLSWGFLVAAGLVIGALPALLGLVIVLPVLGHATWHFYRRAVA